MIYNFPSSNYTSDDEYDVDINTSPFHEISESQTSKGGLCLQVDGYCYTNKDDTRYYPVALYSERYLQG